MNKLLILAIVVITILPILGIMSLPPNADTLGKEFAKNNPGIVIGISTIEEDISEQEEINRASIIIEGLILKVTPFWKIDTDPKHPYIHSEYTVKVNEVIKGNMQVGQTISVTMRGGSLDGITTQTDSLDIEFGDNVIMLLGKDTNSIWGDSYVPISITKSTYLLENDIAKNKLESKTMNKIKLKDKLKNLSKPS